MSEFVFAHRLQNKGPPTAVMDPEKKRVLAGQSSMKSFDKRCR